MLDPQIVLADRLVSLEVVDRVSPETVRKTVKNELKPWRQEMWCLPGTPSAEFVCAMEDVLGCLYPALRSPPSRGMPGRDEQTVGGRGAGPPSGDSGTCGSV